MFNYRCFQLIFLKWENIPGLAKAFSKSLERFDTALFVALASFSNALIRVRNSSVLLCPDLNSILLPTVNWLRP